MLPPWGIFLFLLAVTCATGSASAQEPLNLIARQRADDKRILAALEKHISADFKKLPLDDVADYFQEMVGVEVHLDRLALEQAKIDCNSPVTITMKDVSARAILNLVLANLGLTWTVIRDVVIITTPERAKSKSYLTVWVQDVTDLAGATDTEPANHDTLINLITNIVAPSSWDTVGNNGSIEPYDAPGTCSLKISQTLPVHEEIEELLGELRKLSKAAAKPESPAKEPLKTSSSDLGEPPLTPDQKKILAALNRRVSIDLHKASWNDAAWHFRDALKERVLIDQYCISSRPNASVTLHLNNATIREALDALVQSLDADGEVVWQVGPEAVQIGDKDSRRLMQTKTYDVSDLIEDGDSPEKCQERCDQLVKLILSTIAPKHWETVDGHGTIMAYPYGKRAALIVSQTWSVHRDVAALLAELRKKAHGKLSAAAPVVVQPEPRPSDDAAEKALAGRITVEFNKASLVQAAEMLSKKIGVPFVVDEGSFLNAGMDPKSPRHTFRAVDFPVRSVLDQLLGEYECSACEVVNGNVLIAEETDLDSGERYITKVYDVRDLVTYRDKAGKRFTDVDTLIEAITSTYFPLDLNVEGGGVILPFEHAGAVGLCVKQIRPGHQHIEQLLADLRQVLRPNADDPPLGNNPLNNTAPEKEKR